MDIVSHITLTIFISLMTSQNAITVHSKHVQANSLGTGDPQEQCRPWCWWLPPEGEDLNVLLLTLHKRNYPLLVPKELCMGGRHFCWGGGGRRRTITHRHTSLHFIPNQDDDALLPGKAQWPQFPHYLLQPFPACCPSPSSAGRPPTAQMAS